MYIYIYKVKLRSVRLEYYLVLLFGRIYSATAKSGGARGGRASGGVFSGTDPETFSKCLAVGRENKKIGLYSGISVRPLAPLAAAQEIPEYYPIFLFSLPSGKN